MEAPKREYKGSYLLGAFLPISQSNGAIESGNPGDRNLSPVRCDFQFDHVHEAVVSAQRGFRLWGRTPPRERISALGRYRDRLKGDRQELARLICFETGKPLWEAHREVDEAVSIVDYFLVAATDQISESGFEASGGPDQIRVSRRPRGVIAVVAPGISPLSDSHLHLMPALSFGNTVVLKGSRHAPLVAQAIAERMDACELPSGVFNLVQGDAEVARRLVAHPGVQAVFYTGSYETGLTLKKQTVSDYWKVTVLDTVGKNGVLLWEDCDYERALHEAVYSCLLTTGQRRTTASRVLVHTKLADRFLADLHRLYKAASVGYGYVETPDAPFLGPLLNDTALENYIRYQGIAVREGAEEIMRGKSLERPQKGHYVSPSIHLVPQADPKSVYQRSEIFGPNTAVYPISDLEQAVEALNLSQHGLVASVYTRSEAVFLKAHEGIEVGLLHWNRPTHSSSHHIPRGGLKKSGNARPLGSLAWQQCTYPVVATRSAEGDSPAALPEALPRSEGPR